MCIPSHRVVHRDFIGYKTAHSQSCSRSLIFRNTAPIGSTNSWIYLRQDLGFVIKNSSHPQQPLPMYLTFLANASCVCSVCSWDSLVPTNASFKLSNSPCHLGPQTFQRRKAEGFSVKSTAIPFLIAMAFDCSWAWSVAMAENGRSVCFSGIHVAQLICSSSKSMTQ